MNVLAKEAFCARVTAFSLGFNPEDITAETEFFAELDVSEARIVLYLLERLLSFLCGSLWCCAKLSIGMSLNRVATLASAEIKTARFAVFTHIKCIAELESAILVLASDVE